MHMSSLAFERSYHHLHESTLNWSCPRTNNAPVGEICPMLGNKFFWCCQTSNFWSAVLTLFFSELDGNADGWLGVGGFKTVANIHVHLQKHCVMFGFRERDGNADGWSQRGLGNSKTIDFPVDSHSYAQRCSCTLGKSLRQLEQTCLRHACHCVTAQHAHIYKTYHARVVHRHMLQTCETEGLL